MECTAHRPSDTPHTTREADIAANIPRRNNHHPSALSHSLKRVASPQARNVERTKWLFWRLT